MTKKIVQFIAGAALIFGIALIPIVPESANAIDVIGDVCEGASDSAVCDNSTEGVDNFLGVLVNTLLFIVGLLAVIVIIVSGIRYVTSAGNATAVANAKNMLVAAIIGLVIAFLAYAIVNWVLGLFAPAPTTPPTTPPTST